MKSLIKKIEVRSEQLANNQFCHWIKNQTTQNKEEFFVFTPSMLYFVLGFKDILSHLHVENPKTEIEEMINTHCLEDKNHWKWYLQDLKTLGLCENHWGKDWVNFVLDTWDDNNKPTRDLVYLCIHMIKKFNNPIASLVIVECVESTFGVFMNAVKTQTDRLKQGGHLHYFGDRHQEQEMSHNLGHWIDEDDAVVGAHDNHAIFDKIKLSAEEDKMYTEMVHQIYDQFEHVFESWLENKDKFIQFVQPTQHPAQNSVEITH